MRARSQMTCEGQFGIGDTSIHKDETFCANERHSASAIFIDEREVFWSV